MCSVCGCSDNHNHDGHSHSRRLVQVEQDIMAKNDTYAAQNRAYFKQQNLRALNLLSSPGSGKTTLLTATIKALKDQLDISVIEGDQSTQIDTDRILATGVSAIQVNTGKGCHLDAHRIGHAIQKLKPSSHSVLMIENVGNLVCPAGFDLGENYKVVILSVTEGEDKPLKYPDMFHAADLMIINKTDLLPYVDFNIAQCFEYVRRVNPDIEMIPLSATKGEQLTDWTQWIQTKLERLCPERAAS